MQPTKSATAPPLTTDAIRAALVAQGLTEVAERPDGRWFGLRQNDTIDDVLRDLQDFRALPRVAPPTRFYVDEHLVIFAEPAPMAGLPHRVHLDCPTCRCDGPK